MSYSPVNNEKTHEKTSILLRRATLDLQGEKIQVGFLLYRLRRRSFGGLLFFLAILSLIPGISIFAGLVMIILAAQLSLGFRSPKLPRVMSEYSLKIDHLKTILSRTAPKIERLEKYIKPRLLIFTLPPFTSVLGILVFCLAALVILPLPFTNLFPALAIFIISMGLLERDGLIILVGTTFSILAFALGGTIVYLTLQGLEAIL